MLYFNVFFFQLTETYRNSLVGDSFDRIDIEAFSRGSVLVDYYVYFKDFGEEVKTSDLKTVLNQQMEDTTGDTMLGRFKVDPGWTDFIGMHLILINYIVYWLFNYYLILVVEHEMSAPSIDEEDSSALPDWAIAVIVIGLGSFAFVLVFGITVVRKCVLKGPNGN
jgi:hypothetical protein